MAETFYDRLGLQPDASSEAIKVAYRRLARQVHPDIDPSPRAVERFQRISEAYATLSDPRKRLSYNQSVLAARRGIDSLTPPQLSRRELRAAYERVVAYGVTGTFIAAGAIGIARWFGGALHPWQLAALGPISATGAGLGLLFGIDANFVIGDFVHPRWRWPIRIVRFASWMVGLPFVARQLLVAANLGVDAIATTLTRDITLASLGIGLAIALVTTLRDH